MKRNQILGIVFSVLAIFLFSKSGFAQVENAYVTNFGGDSVSVINTATNSLVEKIPVGEEPVGIAINSSCTTAYVVNFLSNSISAINLGRNNVFDTLTSPDIQSPNDVIISPDDSTLYVDGPSNNVLVIDTSTLSISTTIPVGDTVQTMAITPDGTKLFAATNNDYSVIDTATNTVLDTIAIPPPFIDVQRFTVSPDGQRIYLPDRLASVSGIAGIIISTATNQVIGNMAPIPDPVAATFLGFVPNSSKAYLSGGNSTGNDLMQIYDPDNNLFTGSFFVGSRATDMAFTQDGTRAYVVRGNFFDDASAVAVVNTASDQLIDTINFPPIDDPARIAICVPQPSVVPTISEWGMIVMVGVFAIAAVVFLRRRAVA